MGRTKIQIVLVFFVLFVVEETYAGRFIRLGYMGAGTYGIGLTCDYDDDCLLPHTYCYRQETCQCKRGFQPAEDGSECIILTGARCYTSNDCSSLQHSECVQEQCQCSPGFVSNQKGTECLPSVRHYRGPCTTEEQCTSIMGKGSYCSNSHRCECKTEFHFAPLESLCLENRGLYQSCSKNVECYIGEGYETTIECYTGQCRCRYGYYPTENNKCISSSAVIQGKLITVLIGLTTILIKLFR